MSHMPLHSTSDRILFLGTINTLKFRLEYLSSFFFYAHQDVIGRTRSSVVV